MASFRATSKSEDWGDRGLEISQRLRKASRFSSRPGMAASSPPPYDSLNLGFHVGDDPHLVRENRRRLAVELEVDPASITCPRQRHTAEVAVVRSEGQIGSGALREESVFDPCDGLVTALKRVPILLHFADCLPVVLVADSGSTVPGNAAELRRSRATDLGGPERRQ